MALPDASSRILYGNTLPPTAGAQVGDVFFLTADIGDGRGLYICTADNVWTHLAWGGVGNTLPPGGADGDVFIVNGGPNIGIYQYYGGTWNIVGSPRVVDGPVTYNDFTNAGLWMPYGHPAATQSFVGNGLLIQGNLTFAANTYAVGMSGMMGLMRVYPDAAGDLDFTVVFDSYVRPTDLVNTRWFFALGVFNEVERMTGDEFAFFGYGGLTAVPGDEFRVGQITPGTGLLAAFANFAAAPPAATTFTMQVQIGNKNIGAYQIKALNFAQCTMDGGGGPLGGAIGVPNTYYWYPADFMGFRPFVGAIWDHTSQLAQARVTSFTVTTGRVILPF